MLLVDDREHCLDPTPILRIDSALGRKQVERLTTTRAKRDSALTAARAPTEGEMISTLQEVFGTYTESPVF